MKLSAQARAFLAVGISVFVLSAMLFIVFKNVFLSPSDSIGYFVQEQPVPGEAGKKEDQPKVDAVMPGACVCKQGPWRAAQAVMKNSVVQIFSSIAQFNWIEPYKTPQQGMAAGTGFFINERGELLTNAHVVDQSVHVSIQIPSCGKRRFDVDLVGLSMERDLALLRLTPQALGQLKACGGFNYVKMGDSDQVSRADQIMVLGFPMGQECLKSTTGVVSGREQIDGRYMIQIDAATNPGNSGGPAVNMNGDVIGIDVSKMLNAENVGYIIPINEAKLVLQQFEKMEAPNNKIKLLRKPFLGVLFTNATEFLTEFLHNPLPGGLYVVETYKGSPLDRAGVRAGDMIYQIDSFRVDEFGEISVPWSEDKVSISAYVARLRLGDTIRLVIYRKGSKKEISFKFKESELTAIRFMFPGYEPVDYEVFGGMVVMPLTLNHLGLLVQAAPELARYTEFKNQINPALIVTHIFPNSLFALGRTFGPGAVLSEVNGTPVKTLDEFRKAVLASASSGFLTIKTTENVFAVLPVRATLEQEEMLQKLYFYPESPLVGQLKKALKIDEQKQKTA